MFAQDSVQEVILKPVPEFSDINYAGDGRLFDLKGNDGKVGITGVYTGPGTLPYDNNLTEEVDGELYSKFFCDYLVTSKLKLQGADLKLSRGGECDFLVLEVLFRANADPELWVLGKRFVRRFYISTDFEDQDTPNLPYSKTLESGVFIIRAVYYKHHTNNQDQTLRVNYQLHEVKEDA